MTLARATRPLPEDFRDGTRMTEHQTSPPPGITPSPVIPAPDTDHVTAQGAQPVPASGTLDATSQVTVTSNMAAIAQVTAQQAYLRATRPWFRRKRFALPSAVVIVFLILMVSTGGNDPGIFDRTRSAAEVDADIADNIPSGALGQSVRDGRFAFTVTSPASYGNTIPSRSGTPEKAQGVFVIVRVDVTNIGYQATTLTATDQFLVSDKGQRFATSPAISALAGAETIFAENINPGHTVKGAPILFDVPAGVMITSIEFHDSVASTGVKVKLS
jgi:hypothetical protein